VHTPALWTPRRTPTFGSPIAASPDAAQGFDVELRQLGDHWRANFYATGMAHSVVYGSGWETTPWRAVSWAAWQAISDPRMAA